MLRIELDKKLEPLGLSVLAIAPFVKGKSIFLIGHIGRAISYLFDRDDFTSVSSDPLDTWSKQVLAPIAKEFKADVVYPFEGPPHHPFVSWGVESGKLFQSPLGILIHPEYGLWQGIRGAFIFELDTKLNSKKMKSPCESCQARPCLSACIAFSTKGFSPKLCREKVGEKGCMEKGCLARNSCPVGRQHMYQLNQRAFHMQALAKYYR